MTRVKICGLTRVEDVELAVELGASAVGFVLEPTSLRQASLPEIGELLESVPPYVYSVAVLGKFVPSYTYNSFDAVQAIGVTNDQLEASQRAISVYRPGSEDAVPEKDSCSAVLLDAYSEDSYGGTGKRIDIEAARRFMAEAVRSVIIAGGLTPENVGEVVRELRPYAVDVSSGIEVRPGIKDHTKMREFFQAVAEADSSR